MIVTLKGNDYSFSDKVKGKRVIARERISGAIEVKASEFQRVGVDRSLLPASLSSTYILTKEEFERRG